MYRKILTIIAWALCAIRDFVFSIWSILKKWYRPEWYKWCPDDEIESDRLYGADKINEDSIPGLIFPTIAGDLEQVNHLIQDGVDLNTYWGPTKITALMHAASFGRSEIVHALIKAGADVHQTCRRGHTALYYLGASLNPGGEELDRKLIDIGKALLEAGARDENTQELVAGKETYRKAEEDTTIASGDLVNPQVSLFICDEKDNGEFFDPEDVFLKA